MCRAQAGQPSGADARSHHGRAVPLRQPSRIETAPSRPPQPPQAPKPAAAAAAAAAPPNGNAVRPNASGDSSDGEWDGQCVPATVERPGALARDPADSLHASRLLNFQQDAGRCQRPVALQPYVLWEFFQFVFVEGENVVEFISLIFLVLL